MGWNSTFRIYRKEQGNYYPLKEDGRALHGEADVMEISAVGLANAAEFAVIRAEELGHPFRPGELMLVHNVNGGIGIFELEPSPGVTPVKR